MGLLKRLNFVIREGSFAAAKHTHERRSARSARTLWPDISKKIPEFLEFLARYPYELWGAKPPRILFTMENFWQRILFTMSMKQLLNWA